jgi:HAD superfamily hydrolase (TIGR01509 family)
VTVPGSSIASSRAGEPALATDVDLRAVRTLLCDADGNLFPSEEPAYTASVGIVNRLMESIGAAQRFEAEELRRSSTGKNFRTLASELTRQYGRCLSDVALDGWVAEEKDAVSDHLRRVLGPDAEVVDVLSRLSDRYELAAVSSSALSRLDACFAVTGLSELLPPERRFSAEDSLARPASKPDPAVYRAACARLGVRPGEALAIEDSPTGVLSAVSAGVPTVGNVRFVPADEREDRIKELASAGALAVVPSWRALEKLLERWPCAKALN